MFIIVMCANLYSAAGQGADAAAVATLLQPFDKAAERSAAQTLGDTSIERALDLGEKEKAGLDGYVLRCLERAKSESAEERLEARRQVERLWRAAAPTLLKQLDNKDPTQLELVIKSLLLMRNEAIIQEMIERGFATQDSHTRQWIVFTLRKMNEPREALVPGRTCLGKEESAELFERLVKPALAQLAREGPEK